MLDLIHISTKELNLGLERMVMQLMVLRKIAVRAIYRLGRNIHTTSHFKSNKFPQNIDINKLTQFFNIF